MYRNTSNYKCIAEHITKKAITTQVKILNTASTQMPPYLLLLATTPCNPPLSLLEEEHIPYFYGNHKTCFLLIALSYLICVPKQYCLFWPSFEVYFSRMISYIFFLGSIIHNYVSEIHSCCWE